MDLSRLEKILTLSEACRLLRTDEKSALAMVASGSLWAAVLPDGSIGISQSSVRALLPREELPDYKDFAHLKGEAISISDASRKYNIHTSTLTRWMQRGYIAVIGKEGRRTLLDEADVAYCARVYSSDSGQGKWLFDPLGKPVQAGKRRQKKQPKSSSS